MDTVTLTKEIKTTKVIELKLPKFILSSLHAHKDGLNLCEATQEIFKGATDCCPEIACDDCLLNHIKLTKE